MNLLDLARAAIPEGLVTVKPETTRSQAEARQRAAIKATEATKDPRRRCDQCRNLSDRGQCMAALRSQPLGFDVPRMYYPAATLPQCCAGYLPFPDDPDQRPGVERWPTLLARALP